MKGKPEWGSSAPERRYVHFKENQQKGGSGKDRRRQESLNNHPERERNRRLQLVFTLGRKRRMEGNVT